MPVRKRVFASKYEIRLHDVSNNSWEIVDAPSGGSISARYCRIDWVMGPFFGSLLWIGTISSLNIPAFILCYIFIAIVLYYFIIREKRSILESFLLGLCIYAIYELTNKTLFTNWKWTTVIIDSIWGGLLFMIVTKIFYMIKWSKFANQLY